jgi:DNA polymerase-3 subunit delta'
MWDVIGQERAVALLRRAIEDESRLSHAYLFVGPEHVGRATTARRFAQALNCERGLGPPSEAGGMLRLPPVAEPFQARPEEDGQVRKPGLRNGADASLAAPCGECRSCRHIEEDKHPDVEWLGVGGLCEESEHKDHSADNSRDIRICQVRRLERVVSRAPFEGRYRVVIIDPAEAMTIEAANAFLKTLEEPPAQVVLVLLTAHEEALRETVRSRCRRVVFSGVPRALIEEALRERWGAEAPQAERLACLAQGRLGWAVAALQNEELLAERERVVDEIDALLSGDLGRRFSYASSLGVRYPLDPQAVRDTLELWRGYWRDVLLMAAGQETLVADVDRLDTLRPQAAQYGVGGALRALTAVGDAAQHLEQHANPTLALEVMLLELPERAAQR